MTNSGVVQLALAPESTVQLAVAVPGVQGPASIPAAGGANTQVQYNNAGGLVGSADFTWNNGTKVLTVAGTVAGPALELGTGATGDQTVLIDMVGDTTYTDYGLRLQRAGGANGGSYIVNRGTGALTLRNVDAAPVTIQTSNTERLRIDSSGRLLVGATAIPAGNIGGFGNQYVQVLNQSAIAGIAALSTDNSIFGAQLFLGKSRGGTTTIVQNGDTLGQVVFAGADGVDIASAGATIAARVAGTPGADDLPCRLVFSTTADGAATPTERMRIDSTGVINFASCPTYANDSAAGTGGLVAGDIYKTSTGELRIKL
jgi:hypothetical protein